jgi:lipid II isoglutaminyl synthase (glutamine-hydrolysing)
MLATGGRFQLDLDLPGRCNRANALMALAGALSLGADGQCAVQAMAAVSEVAGRYATLEVGGLNARLLLAKNPAGWAEVFDMLRPAPAPVVIAINARTADGHDPSWLWDVPFELLRGRHVVATGERGLDLAVRLHYAEVDHAREPDLLAALGAAGAADIDVVANYTAFHQLLARVSNDTGRSAPA